MASGRSAISSKKILSLWALVNMPTLSRTAPVKEPLTWPNNSDSTRFSGMALQFTATNVSWARA